MIEFKYIQLEAGESENSLGLYMYEEEEGIDDRKDQIEELIRVAMAKSLSESRLDKMLRDLLDVHRIHPYSIKLNLL